MGQHPEPTAQPWPYWMLRFIASNGDEDAYSDLVWSVAGSPPYGGVGVAEADAVYELLEAYVGPGVAGADCYDRVSRLLDGRPDAVLALAVFRIHDRIASDPDGFAPSDVAAGRTFATESGHAGLATYFDLLAAEVALRNERITVAKDLLLAVLPRLTALAADDRAYVGQARVVAQNAAEVAATVGDTNRARIATAVMEVLAADPALAARYATDLAPGQTVPVWRFADLAREGAELLRAGDLAGALDRFTRAESVAGAEGREAGLCAVLGDKALAYDRAGDLRAAIDTYDRAIELCLRHGDVDNLSRSTTALVALLVTGGALDEAEQLLPMMLDAARRTGRPDRLTMAETHSAAYLAACQRYQEAADRLVRAGQHAGDDPTLADAVRRDTVVTHFAWGEALWQEGSREPAAAVLRTVVRLADPTSADECPLAVRAHLLLAELHDAPAAEEAPPAQEAPPAREAPAPEDVPAADDAERPETVLEVLERDWLETGEPATGVALGREHALAGRATAAMSVLNAVRGRIESGADEALRIEFLTAEGLAHRAVNDTAAMHASLSHAHQLALAAEPSPAGVAATHQWGVALAAAGRADEAVEVLEGCLPRVRALGGHPTAEAFLGQALGQALHAKGDAAGAERVLSWVTEIFRADGDPHGLGRTMALRADLALSLDDLDTARRHLLDAADLAERAGDLAAHAATLSSLATVHVRAGSPAEAAGYHERAAVEYRELGAAEEERTALLNLVECHLQLGYTGAAEEALQPLLAPDAPVIISLASRTYFLAALLRAEQGDWSGARPALRQYLDSLSRDSGGDRAYELVGAAAVRAGDATFAVEVTEARRAASFRPGSLRALEEITAALPAGVVAAYLDLAPALTVLCAGHGGWSAICERPGVGTDDVPLATGTPLPSGRLDAMGRLLGRELWTPLLELVPEGTTGIVLLPSPRLVGLPLAAAPLPDGRYVGERIRIAYAPSLNLLRRPDDELALPRRGLGQAVDLPFIRRQALSIASDVTGPVTTLTGAEATVDAMHRLLRTRDVVHLATAQRDLTIPGPIGATLVLLSGEPVGPPETLLVAGASRVIATHWTVGDLGAALLVGEFFRCWRDGAVPAATALAAAQRSMRTEMSNADVVKTLRQWAANEPADDTLNAALAEWESRTEDAPAFAGTVDWAAFHLLGLP